ncbi:hypothetical protein GMRT_15224 [Giardia muris]|uniref:Nascent polypeptide-associated complex subunit beta n=1 Tax=Giardia muris TaxID=5742 RepID=A0A4Z1SX94_GIAMU|nr:hypothetical protein GMRT_15224 [Giardia muris]|eukprot:TNJ28148.1 hypothetical protein GMRT_15224 [Giardia muris]
MPVSAETKAKLDAIRKRKSALPKGFQPVPKEEVAMADQAKALSEAGLKEIPMDCCRIYQGDKVIEIVKPRFFGNPRTNVWAVRGGATAERTPDEIPARGMSSEEWGNLLNAITKGREERAKQAAQAAEEPVEAEDAKGE